MKTHKFITSVCASTAAADSLGHCKRIQMFFLDRGRWGGLEANGWQTMITVLWSPCISPEILCYIAIIYVEQTHGRKAPKELI